MKVGQADLKTGSERAGLKPAEPSELGALREAEACGMRGVAVKCIDIEQNAECEGSVPCRH